MGTNGTGHRRPRRTGTLPVDPRIRPLLDNQGRSVPPDPDHRGRRPSTGRPVRLQDADPSNKYEEFTLGPDRISLNAEVDGCETFVYPPDRKRNVKIGIIAGYGACITDAKPYDALVGAAMLAIKHHLGDDAKVQSAGDPQHPAWQAAKALYSRTFPEREIPWLDNWPGEPSRTLGRLQSGKDPGRKVAHDPRRTEGEERLHGRFPEGKPDDPTTRIRCPDGDSLRPGDWTKPSPTACSAGNRPPPEADEHDGKPEPRRPAPARRSRWPTTPRPHRTRPLEIKPRGTKPPEYVEAMRPKLQAREERAERLYFGEDGKERSRRTRIYSHQWNIDKAGYELTPAVAQDAIRLAANCDFELMLSADCPELGPKFEPHRIAFNGRGDAADDFTYPPDLTDPRVSNFLGNRGEVLAPSAGTTTPWSAPSCSRSSTTWARRHTSRQTPSPTARAGRPPSNSTPAPSRNGKSPGSTTGRGEQPWHNGKSNVSGCSSAPCCCPRERGSVIRPHLHDRPGLDKPMT